MDNTSLSTSTFGFYNTPQLVDVIVTPSAVELIYTRQAMVSTGYGFPNPEVYKVVYSRNDGTEKTIFGEYIPATKEQYKF
jgi:hypothetical protein